MDRQLRAATLLSSRKNHSQAFNVQVGASSLFYLPEIDLCWDFYSPSTGGSSCTNVKVTLSLDPDVVIKSLPL